MSEYDDASFDNESNKSKTGTLHGLKLSIDLMSLKSMATAGNVFVTYKFDLVDSHCFTSHPATSVQTGSQETRINNGFASFEFQASKAQLFGILNERNVTV